MASALPLGGPWGVWAGLVLAGTLGSWSERTKLGKELSGALVATLTGMAFSNLGLIPAHATEYHIVNKFLLPLAIPMLLYAANLRRVLNETGRLLPAFLLGALATVVGSVVAMHVVPLTPLAGEGWKVAAALTARHIGGAVNYVAVSESLSISSSSTGAGLAADDLILTLYFSALYSMARGVPAEAPSGSSVEANKHGSSGSQITVLEGLTAVCISAVICFLGTTAAAHYGLAGQSITIITAITVCLATLMPNFLAPYVRSGEGLAQMLMQVFFATVGANAQVATTISKAPVLFGFSFVALAVHLVLLLVVGRALGFSRRDLLLASNANIGGPSTVAGMAAAKGWASQIVPAILTSTMGYAIGTFIGMTLGFKVLKPMDVGRLWPLS